MKGKRGHGIIGESGVWGWHSLVQGSFGTLIVVIQDRSPYDESDFPVSLGVSEVGAEEEVAWLASSGFAVVM